MDRVTRQHRLLAIFTFAAVVCYCSGTAIAAAPSTEKLQALVNATAAQMQLAYRQHPEERARRHEQLIVAVAAWREAQRTEANNERLAVWLREAILSSMPGSNEPLPAVPNFAVIVKVEPQPAARTGAHETSKEPTLAGETPDKKGMAETIAKPQDDPFRDDPPQSDK